MLSTGTSASDVLTDNADESWNKLRSRVDGVRSKQRMKYLGTGVLAALAIFVAAFLGFSAADILFKLSVGTRVFALFSTVIAVAFAIFQWIYRPWSVLGSTVQSAREVEGAFPELEQQLSTALEFGADKEKAAKFASPLLVAALVNQAGARSEPLDFARTIRWKQLAWAFAVAFVLAMLMGVYAAKSRRLFAITWARFMKPTAEILPPTLTEISRIEPGDAKFPMESSVPIVVALEGKQPDTALLSILIGEEKDNHWEDRPMDRGEDGLYRATVRRLLDSARYKIHAGDAESREFKINVFKTPEITEFSLRIEHPAYTGKGIESLPPGTGDVRALRGSKIHVDIKSNVDLGKASVAFKSRRAELGGTSLAVEPRKASVVFDVDKDDEYQVKIADTDGNPGTGALFQIKALRDRYPRVTIKKPEKDLMVHKEQTIEVEISADDDIGVKEIGIFHSIDVDEKQIMVRRLDPQPVRVEGKLVWELGTMNLKGGEVIAYYAYAIDNDSVSVGGPKMSKSDIHFLTVYDEEKYDSEKEAKKKKDPPGTPPEIKQLDKLIDAQKKLLKDTFSQARSKESLRDKEDSERAKAVENEKVSALKTGDAQKQLRARVAALVDEVKKELEKAAEAPEAAHAEGPDAPKKPALGEKELKHLEQAMEKMKSAEGDLQKPDAPGAVKPETEALRHLSETRRLLLSDKEGDPRFKQAMNKNSKKKQKQDQDQQQQDQQKAKEQLAEMPKMMEREKELERELEELKAKKQKPPAGDPKSEERKQQEADQEKLQRKAEDDVQKLAKEAEERAKELERLADRNNDIKPAADKMKDAADKLDQASKDVKQGKPKDADKAQEKNQQAQQDSREAQRNLRNALEKLARQEMANAEKDAKELAQRQQALAEQMQQLQNEPKQGEKPAAPKQDGQKQDGQKPDAQKQDGQKQDGQKQDGQKQDGQKQDGQKQDGQKQDGQKPDGKQSGGQPQGGQPQDSKPGESPSQSASVQQKMRGMANAQRDIQSDLKDLNERVKNLADKANQENLGGSKEVDQAQKQSSEESAAGKGAESAKQAMSSGKQEDAAREANNAAKAMQKLAETLQDAKQKTEAGDMKQLATAMKKLQTATKEQADIGKDIADKKDANDIATRQEKVGETAKDVADASSHLETLRQNGTQDSAKHKLENAVKQADEAAKQVKEGNTPAAKAAADQTEKSLNQALSDMERAAGKTMEEKAREAKNLVKSARENQEKANAAIKDVPNKADGEKLEPAEAGKRDDATASEDQAARDAKRLDLALEGLKELAKDANPAAAEAANDARETTQKAELPAAMEKLSNDMKKFGTPKKPQDPAGAKTPAEANKKGEELAQTLKQVDKQLDEYVAESRNSVEERLKAMEDAARKAAESAKALAEKNTDPNAKKEALNNPKNPDGKPTPDQPKTDAQTPRPDDPKSANEKKETNTNDPKNPKSSKPDANKLGEPTKADQAKVNDRNTPDPDRKNDTKNPEASKGEEDGKPSDQETAKQEEALKQMLKKLQPKLDRLEANSPERAKMKDVISALEQGDKKNENESEKPNGPPKPGKKNLGGAAFKNMSKQLEEISQGIMERRERLLRARDIRPDEDDDAPKEYRALVDKYYRALSEDVESDRK